MFVAFLCVLLLAGPACDGSREESQDLLTSGGPQQFATSGVGAESEVGSQGGHK